MSDIRSLGNQEREVGMFTDHDITRLAKAIVKEMAAQQQPQAAPPGSLTARINQAKADLSMKCQRRTA